jgi:hypothetical protein
LLGLLQQLHNEMAGDVGMSAKEWEENVVRATSVKVCMYLTRNFFVCLASRSVLYLLYLQFTLLYPYSHLCDFIMKESHVL